MSSEDIIEETQLEESTEVDDGFSQKLVLEESLSFVEDEKNESQSVLDSSNNENKPVEKESKVTEKKVDEGESKPLENKIIHEEESKIEEKAVEDESKIEENNDVEEETKNDNTKSKNISDAPDSKKVDNKEETVQDQEMKDINDIDRLESQDMFENEDKIETIELDKSENELRENEASRKRKADEIESNLPTKLKKSESESDGGKSVDIEIQEKTEDTKPSEVVKSNSSTESNVSYSVLSGKINLSQYEKSLNNSTVEVSSSVEIIENSSEDSKDIIDLAKDSSNSLEIVKSEDMKDSITNGGTTTNGKIDEIHEAETEPVETEKLLNSDSNISKPVNSDSETTNKQLPDHFVPDLVDKSDNISPIAHKDSSVCTQNGSSSTPNLENDQSDSFKLKPEISTKKHIFYVEVTYTVSEDKDVVNKEITQVLCEDISEINNYNKRISDVSTGALGDVSKNTSPSSSISVPPFNLPNRYSILSNTSRLSTLSRYSTSSSSSIMSSASALAGRSSIIRNEEHFLIPEIPLNKSKDKQFMDSKNLTTDQVSFIKSHWNNSEQLLKILDAIDHSPYSMNISANYNEKTSPSAEHLNDENDIIIEREKLRTPEKKLESINEMNTPKSEKRSTRKKRVPKSLAENSETSEVSTPTSNNRGRGARKTKRTNTIDQDIDNQSSSNNISDMPIQSGNISVGQSVFARWTDRKYYSGIVQEHVKGNKWNVKFDDGNTKVLIEDYILSGCHTLLKGHSVYARIKKSGEYETGIVTELWLEKGKVRYKVEIDGGAVVKAFADELFLTEDQAKTVKELNRIVTPPGTPKLGLVTLDNIVEGKRATRSNRKYANAAFSPRPGVSGTRKMTPRKLDSEDEKSIDSRSECALEEVGGVEPELKNFSTPAKANKGPGKVKGTVKATNRLPKYKLQDDIFGPIPENSNIFNGLSFILVCSNTSVRSNKTSEENSVSESDTENEMREFTKIPFLEEHLVQQINGGGGVLYQHFEDIPPSDYDMCKLISNRPNKTAKYIQCIAAGITILNHEWIVRCCRENKRLPFQELPIGWSLEKNKFIDSYHRKKDKPFQDLLIYLAPNVDKQFLKFWERVCSLAGGTIIVMTDEDIDFSTATLLLADNDCPESIVDRALNWGIPILSTNWVIQSIIHGEARPFDGHSKYAYDSIDEDV
ncbi:uncharacterized protein LOC123298626 [Chrysoperla carnea]|uniref:uncharacterized protein LOC123298626 n=1 Tax=Chrysoperla carnea TaxID=189513 RepID=UPI001D0910B9|nr:uncharacterized protein LOC123298626 [Chrysoperla carnea]